MAEWKPKVRFVPMESDAWVLYLCCAIDIFMMVGTGQWPVG